MSGLIIVDDNDLIDVNGGGRRKRKRRRRKVNVQKESWHSHTDDRETVYISASHSSTVNMGIVGGNGMSITLLSADNDGNNQGNGNAVNDHQALLYLMGLMFG